MSLPIWMKLWYRKPQWKNLDEYVQEINQERRDPSPDGQRERQPKHASLSIPSRLSLDRVLDNKTCSPMSLHDFYMYLRYIEHSSENLEFYLWYKQYDAHYPDDQREEITDLDADLRAAHLSGMSRVSSVAEIIYAKKIQDSVSSISDTISTLEPPCARAMRADASWNTIFRWSLSSSRPRSSTPQGCSANGCRFDCDDDLERASAIPPPLFAHLTKPRPQNRAELDAAIATYLRPGAEKELNISHPLRQRTLRRLRESSDPRYLRPVADHIYEVMKNCSHRNFVRLGISTGTYETICVGNMIGILNIIAGFVLVLVRALYPHIGAHSRWNVFYSFPLWWLGTTVMLVGTQGMCSIMLALSKRQTLPWERIEEESHNAIAQDKEAAKAPSWWRKYRDFMNRTMAHDRNFRVEDANLRWLQRMILIQCNVYGILAASCCVLLFVFLPMWKETVPFRDMQT